MTRTFSILLLSSLCAFPAAVNAHAEVNPAFAEHFNVVSAGQELDRRAEIRTYLTYPEWYIVYSAEEYGDFVEKGGRPSQFPYAEAVSQFWESLREVREASGGSAIPAETKTVLDTIGLSFSFEYAVIGFYESTIGRIFEALNLFKPSPEDRYTNAVAARYGEFLLQTPWYEFPYGEALTGLWSDAWGWGSITPRGIERRIAYTLGYGGKALYAAVIRQATKASFEPAALETAFVAGSLSREALEKIEGVTVMGAVPGGLSAKAPRYRAFTDTIHKIVDSGGRFISIENNAEIMATVLAMGVNQCVAYAGEEIFREPLVAEPSMARFAFKVPVADLHGFVERLNECGIKAEHFYDY